MIDVRTPAARFTDPDTSWEAAEEVTASGERAKQQERTAKAVRRHPGLTSRELARAAGIDRYEVGRRLSECKTAKAVTDGPKRKCAVSGKRAVTWWPVAQQARLVA